MDKKLDVKQIYKDEQGVIQKVETTDGKQYSDEEAIKMVESEIEKTNKEGNNSRNNFMNLVKKGQTFGVVVDDTIKKDMLD